MQQATAQSSNAPKYRADIKGEVASFIDECTECMRHQLSDGENFCFAADDLDAYHEYKDFLTAAELERCFKRARSL